MLGAQALRTKQKAEQKEKEKRHRERLRSIELEREKMHLRAREEMGELVGDMQGLQLSGRRPSGDFLRYDGKDLTPKHRHSMFPTTTAHSLHPNYTPRRQSTMGPQRSTSSDYCRAEKKESGSRIMKWLGLTSSDNKQKRRMSTY